MTNVRTRRVRDHVEDPGGTEGLVVLVDRLWPRGTRKETLPHDLWPKEVAPSTGLRKWFHAVEGDERAARFEEFAERYTAELQEEPAADALAELAREARRHEVVTLLFGARDTENNHAQVLARALRRRL
ncbi:MULTISPECIES: DUF488 domain-containing protein [Kytococcus]|uniref:DUF488 domain-containing protein n=1 Tax=Kytococcus schroeteri TaxID=138300 RepID=A0A2I1P9D9_9MICO|nr:MULTISPECIES: DUF488 family protein [Kytococcus]OFS13830.1 hypothetical protein HMPREF3099_05375 [Kytococcus sp. HMSC28H12]PKZ41254.1 DUF488 domain-containing protein [Kytococcus schroeteri]